MKTYPERSESVTNKIMTLKQKRNRTRGLIAGTSLTLAVVIVAMVLFVLFKDSPPDVSMYADSPYYSLIQTLNTSSYKGLTYKNNFEKLMASFAARGEKNNVTAAPDINLALPNGYPMAGVQGGTTEADGNGNQDSYVEVTDNQVEGVVETDVIKRSEKYIFYLRALELSIYTIEKKDSQRIGHYNVEVFQSQGSYTSNVEMFLSEDCTTVTVIVSGYDSEIGACTALVNLDVTDPQNPVLGGSIYVSGSYLSARMVDGDILLMSKYRMDANIDYEDETTYVPQLGQPGQMHCVAPENILYPETLSNYQYTVICKLDGKTLEEKSTAAVLSYSDNVYVSENHVFVTRSYSENKNDVQKTMTEISCLNYGEDGLKFRGSVAVEGSIKNQYSMDEFEGILRVVTSTNITVTQYHDNGTVSGAVHRNANLYCIDLQNFSVVASVEAFAPAGEQAESVRFDDNYAYVCTAEVITLTDPVYFFDLSDLEHITYKDTGTIDGYSSSLVDFGEGYLVGIGYGKQGCLKIEVYEESETGVESVAVYEKGCDFSQDYKSYLIDREKNLVGLATYSYNGELAYVLLHFNGYGWNELVKVPVSWDLSHIRGVLIDGWLYVFDEDFKVVKVF